MTPSKKQNAEEAAPQANDPAAAAAPDDDVKAITRDDVATNPPTDEPVELTDDQKAATGADDPERQEAALGTDKGYTGEKVDPLPNEAYSLESGPDSPSALEQAQTVMGQRTEALRKSAE